MTLAVTTILFVPEHWRKIQELGASEGTSGSSLVRQWMAREIRAAEKDGRLPAAQPRRRKPKVLDGGTF